MPDMLTNPQQLLLFMREELAKQPEIGIHMPGTAPRGCGQATAIQLVIHQQQQQQQQQQHVIASDDISHILVVIFFNEWW